MSAFFMLVETVFTLGIFFNTAWFISRAIKLSKEKVLTGITFITLSGFTLINPFIFLHRFLKYAYLLLPVNLKSFLICNSMNFLTNFCQFEKVQSRK